MMKTKLTIVLLLLCMSLSSCNIFQKKEISNTNWTSVNFDKNLKVPKIESNDWSYPWHVIKHQDGHFENTMADTILPKDTIHLIHNSKCYSFLGKRINLNEEPYSRLPFCDATLNIDILNIKIYDISASNGEVIFLTILNNKFQLEYKTAYVFPYNDIDFKYLNQYLKLNKNPPYFEGDIIFGEIETKFEETIFFENNKAPTTKIKVIKGTFEVEIK